MTTPKRSRRRSAPLWEPEYADSVHRRRYAALRANRQKRDAWIDQVDAIAKPKRRNRAAVTA